MQPVVDQNWVLVGWLQNSVDVYARDGTPVGNVQGPFGVYSLDGDFRGFYRNGVFRGKDGLVVAQLGNPAEVTDLPELHSFVVRHAASAWPPVVPFQNQWSSDWRSVLTSGEQPTSAAILAPV